MSDNDTAAIDKPDLRNLFERGGHKSTDVPRELKAERSFRHGGRSRGGSMYKTTWTETDEPDFGRINSRYRTEFAKYYIKNPCDAVRILTNEIDDLFDFSRSSPRTPSGKPHTAPAYDTTSDVRNVQENALRLYKPLPERESLPEPIKEFLQNIEDLDDLEKAQHIHRFVVSHMEYDYDEANNEARDSTDYAKVIDNWQAGDCDNYATLQAALLQYAGIEPENIYYVLGQDNNNPGLHNFLILDIDGQLYSADGNIDRVSKLRDDLTAFDGRREAEYKPCFYARLGGQGEPEIVSYLENHVELTVQQILAPPLVAPADPNMN